MPQSLGSPFLVTLGERQLREAGGEMQGSRGLVNPVKTSDLLACRWFFRLLETPGIGMRRYHVRNMDEEMA